jgi:single-stranded-DNA-specific exonuclease
MVQWQRPDPIEVPEELSAAVGSRPVAELLYRRGLRTASAAREFLEGEVHLDPLALPDMAVGTAQIAHAIRQGDRICVYGDYDTDGVTSTALLVGLLRSLGSDVTFHVPDRFREGYGMNAQTVQSLADEGIHLILTCDCGIRNFAEIDLARRLGVKVVVTDHHELGEALPNAEAVINPKRLAADHPCRMLPGVGTAYLFAQSLLAAMGEEPERADRWLDLVGVGIIADVVPLQGANRALARRGLLKLASAPAPGLAALMQVAGLAGAVTAEEVAFGLVPRLNAAGRLADARIGVQLLLALDQEEAVGPAQELDRLNQERKKLTASVVEGALAEVNPDSHAIILYRPEWHEGVLGIAAGKMAEQFGVPALLMTRKHGERTLVGSARAPMGYTLHQALDACAPFLLKHGGHAAAAGLSLTEDRFTGFRVAMLEELRRQSGALSGQEAKRADLAMGLHQVDRPLFEDLGRVGPFGEANPEPVLFASGVKLLSVRPLGVGEKHLRLVFRHGEATYSGVWWGAGSQRVTPSEVDLFYRISLNRWRGEESLQIVVEHLQPEVVQPTAGESVGRTQPLELVDRRDHPTLAVCREFTGAVLVIEGIDGGRQVADRFGVQAVDRFGVEADRFGVQADHSGVQVDRTLILASPLPAALLMDELIALSGAARVVLAFSTKAPPSDERFFPRLLSLLAGELRKGALLSVRHLAVCTGELEPVIRLALLALKESDLLTVEEVGYDLVRVERVPSGKGLRESDLLGQLRALLAESRAYRRFMRQASIDAIAKVIYPTTLETRDGRSRSGSS